MTPTEVRSQMLVHIDIHIYIFFQSSVKVVQLYLIDRCSVYAGASPSALEAVPEPRVQRAAEEETCSCRWATSACVPLWAS